MPRHLISDAHEWINEIPTVPIYYLAKPQPRERAWQNQRGKKTLLSLTLVSFHCGIPPLGVGANQVNFRLVTVKKHKGCRIGGSFRAPVKYHYLYRFFTYSMERNWASSPNFWR
jgi:hypothetical protein